LGKLKGAFVEFLHRMPFYGTAIVCSDDPGVRSILNDIARPVTTYGLNEGAQVRAVDVQAAQGQMRFTVQRRNGVTLSDLPLVLNLPGHHNVLNALAAVAVAVELGVEDAAVQRALASFKGVGRRFQRYGEVAVPGGSGQFTVIDDYGHHPVEMAATLAAARGAFPGRRLVLAFQPHRFSRTRDCFEDFVKVIGQGCDSILLAEVYAAGEAPIVAADGRSLARALRVAGKVEPIFVDQITDMPQAILSNARDGDVLICMGAGSIGAVPGQVVEMGRAA
jgi:UDP-N-acetylmuramate--alanine ligase